MASTLLKELAESICIPLSILFNKSLKEGAHESWMKAIITPIFKKGARSDPGNYRPVSITSVISKVMESIVRDAILAHLVEHKLLAEEQHGFVPGRDCMTQLLLCLEDWTRMIESGQDFDVIYTDFAKAFDSVAHERLFVKLRNIGIEGDLLNWIRTFLTGRTQCVNIESVKSEWAKVVSGIPQGSVLGPLLFVIFINDLPAEVKVNICKMFADDCKLYGAVKEGDINLLQLELFNLERWSKEWQLPFNATKCKVMHFGYHNPQFNYMLNDHTLETTYSEKDLGIYIDNCLKFHVHTAAVTKKANQILGIIKKSYTTRDATTIPILYKAMVRPLLEYGNTIWGPFYQKDVQAVEAIQRRATKLVNQLRDKPYSQRLEELKIPSLAYRRKRGDMIQMFKIMNNLVRIDKNNFFTSGSERQTRGHPQKVFKEHATKRQRFYSFSQRIVNDWNSLPPEVIKATSIHAFKNRLDDHWDHLMYETVD